MGLRGINWDFRSRSPEFKPRLGTEKHYIKSLVGSEAQSKKVPVGWARVRIQKPAKKKSLKDYFSAVTEGTVNYIKCIM